jgi:HAD superfamily hydrolase (TIGR01509 family)
MTPQLVTAVVFDMDGTLIDSLASVTRAYRDAVVAGGGPEPTDDQVVAAFPIGPPRAMLRALLHREVTPADESAYLAALDRHRDAVVPYDGVRELLAALASRGVPVAVFTGASAAAARALLGRADLLRFFDVVVGGDDVPHAKPAPDGVLRACELLGVEPSAAAYVGDSPLDLESARRAGALRVAAAWGDLTAVERRCDVTATVPADVLRLVSR